MYMASHDIAFIAYCDTHELDQASRSVRTTINVTILILIETMILVIIVAVVTSITIAIPKKTQTLNP